MPPKITSMRRCQNYFVAIYTTNETSATSMQNHVTPTITTKYNAWHTHWWALPIDQNNQYQIYYYEPIATLKKQASASEQIIALDTNVYCCFTNEMKNMHKRKTCVNNGTFNYHCTTWYNRASHARNTSTQITSTRKNILKLRKSCITCMDMCLLLFEL